MGDFVRGSENDISTSKNIYCYVFSPLLLQGGWNFSNKNWFTPVLSLIGSIVESLRRLLL